MGSTCVVCEGCGAKDKMGEGEPAPAPAADIMIFISGNSGSKEITNRQHRILMILKSLGIAMKQVDISAPGMDEQRDFKRGRGTPCPHKYSMGKSIVGIMMILMLLMKMTNLRNSLAFQERLQRLSQVKRRMHQRKMKRNHQQMQPQLKEHPQKEHLLKEHLLKQLLPMKHLLMQLLQKRPLLKQQLNNSFNCYSFFSIFSCFVSS